MSAATMETDEIHHTQRQPSVRSRGPHSAASLSLALAVKPPATIATQATARRPRTSIVRLTHRFLGGGVSKHDKTYAIPVDSQLSSDQAAGASAEGKTATAGGNGEVEDEQDVGPGGVTPTQVLSPQPTAADKCDDTGTKSAISPDASPKVTEHKTEAGSAGHEILDKPCATRAPATASGEDLSVAWTATAWLESLHAPIPKEVASNDMPGDGNSQDRQQKAVCTDTKTGRLGLIVDVFARSLLKHVPAQYESEGELDRMRRLVHVDCDTLRECLTAAYDELVESLQIELKALVGNKKVTSTGENKFAGCPPLNFSGLDVFYGGLESLIGAPEPNLQTEGGAKQEWQFQRAMEYEHMHGTDSEREFTTDNYGITTTSQKEWQFVVHPGQEWPVEGPKCPYPRRPVPIVHLEKRMAEQNARLKGLGQTEMILAELVAGRLYTGPVFTKYVVVLRAFQVDEFELRKRFLRLCGRDGSAEEYEQIALPTRPLSGMVVPDAVAGKSPPCAQAWERAAEGANKYTTSLHATNSCIVKMSKLTKATKVYRGVSDMALPMEFLQPNEFGVRGGVEAGFMSTTRDRGVAITYAGETGIGVVFEVQMGMVDRGGDIGWLSQYPHEKEILFGPLSGLEVMAVRTSGMLVVVEAKLSVNLSALTLEQVVAKRQKMVRDMCLQLEFGVQHGIAKDAGGVWTKFFESSALNKSRTLEFLRSWLRSHQDLEADYYNDDASFGHAIEEAVHAAKCVAVWPNKFAQLPIEWKARLGETMESDEPHQAPEEEDLVLAMDHKAHGCVEGVAALLLASDGLKALKLRNANLSAPEVVTVVEAVHHSSCRSSLQRLVLSGNHFDVRGARALARFLAEATAMRELELDEANLTFLGHYSGFQEFCVVLQVNKTLQVLSLCDNAMGSEGARHLASALEKNGTLTELDLSQNKIGDKGAEYLALALKMNGTLTAIDLTTNEIGDEGAEYLASGLEKNGALTTLDLTDNEIGAEGTERLSSALKKNRTLTTLNLDSNGIGKGVEYLASSLEENWTLTTLNLNGIEIGDKGARHLAPALKKNTTLSTLGLNDTEMGAEGALHLASALEKNRTLTTLDLSVNVVGDEGVQHLASALKINMALTTLNLSANEICDDGAKLLATALQTNDTLMTLDLSLNEMGAKGALHLASALEKNRKLMTLDLSAIRICVQGARHLSRALETNTALTTLDLSQKTMGTRGAQHLVSALMRNRKLMTLNLSQNATAMRVKGTMYLALALEENRALTTLDLSQNKIGDKGAKYLALALEKNRALTTLDLSQNKIGDKGAKYLALALEKNRALTTLDLSQNKIGDKGAKYLASALEKNRALRTLDLSQNKIGDKGAKYLASALEKNRALRTLDLSQNKIGDQGAEYLASALKKNRALRTLDIY